MFAFLALAAIAKFSRDGDFPLKKQNSLKLCDAQPMAVSV
jgi:hypothetical protein